MNSLQALHSDVFFCVQLLLAKKNGFEVSAFKKQGIKHQLWPSFGCKGFYG